jgi:hypothetical protein
VTELLFEKSAQNVAPLHLVVKITQIFPLKSSLIWNTYVLIFEQKISELIHRPNGENSPNLVTLLGMDGRKCLLKRHLH